MPVAPAIIRPPRRRRTEPIGKLAILAATRPDLARLRQRLTDPDDRGDALFLGRYYSGTPAPAAFGLAGPFMGAPMAAMLLETLAAWGARRFVFVGWCGALVSSVQSGDVVVPCGAYAEEGTTPAYGGSASRVPAVSAEFQAALNNHLKQNGVNGREGWIWTTDAVFRETADKVRYYRDRGALAVEMELSALFTVGRLLDIELGAVLVVSDELSTLKWRPGFKSERFQAACAAVCEAIATYAERSQP
ncbi:MAG: nucleoside phosphorylase [Desulfobacterales bacterium]|nr:nucleoside phosphorylase [Desulfobacterales bacterium]